VLVGASAVQQGSLLGMVALYPAKYVQTTMSGVVSFLDKCNVPSVTQSRNACGI
jgi:hypothetical protein